MKKCVALIIFVIVGLGFYFSYNEKGKENTYTVNKERIYYLKTVSGECTDNKDIIDSFLTITQQGEKAILNIEEVIGDDTANEETNIDSYNKVIVFDGTDYILDKQDISTKYSYFYKVTGSLPNAEISETQYILANEKYSYEKINQSILSSNSNDQLEYILVCFTNN